MSKSFFKDLFTRYSFIFMFFAGHQILAQSDSTSITELNEVVVKATRATAKSGMAFSNLGKTEIEKNNLGQDVPFLLNNTPSVVVTSDAGAGVGYTGIRIRGTDPTRINVTINGIPYNDSESQGVFWVNMPDIASSASSIQVQRGVGTSTNGAGAFGGSINMNTLQFERNPYGEINQSVGSFNTLKTNIQASTGLIKNHFVMDLRLSQITSDGWVERASSDLKSFYASAGYYNKESFVRLNVFAGKERTYQSWYGTPESLAKGDLAGVDAFVARNFLDENFKNRMLTEGRRFNWYDYENEVDNYQQDHYQLISSFKLGDSWRFNPSLHYTYGRGYFEQFRSGDSFEDYGLQNVVIGNETIDETDLIRQKWLDNHFYGAVWSLEYDAKTKLTNTFGGGINFYTGDHYGEVIWSRFASNSEKGYRWYENVGNKNDFNIYNKSFYQFTDQFNAYLDLQVRTVSFSAVGLLDTRTATAVDETLTFFNPKFGLNYELNKSTSVYGSFAVGNKEPSRQDFVDNPVNIPKAENLQDLELGLRWNRSKQSFESNFYFMNYKNQLVLSGNVNNVGEAIRLNVPESYRAGLELQYAAELGQKFQLAANATFSSNKIANFEETIVSYDGSDNVVNKFSKTDISFSPNFIAGASLSFLPTKGLEIALLPKYVGSQFLDNTSNESRKIDAFFVNNLRVNYNINSSLFKNVTFSLLVNNIFNETYENNGYTYSFKFDQIITENFLYPQAGINFLSAIKVRF